MGKFTVSLDGKKPGNKIYFTVEIMPLYLNDFERVTDLISECKTHADLLNLEKQNIIKIQK